MDYQVKIRGHRIELPEVEHALLAYAYVSDAVALVREREAREPELFCFVTIRNDQTPAEPDGPNGNNVNGRSDA